MNSYERSLINFVLQWCEFGGGEDLILPEFGVVPAEFYNRIMAIVERGDASGLSDSSRLFLRQYCKLRRAVSDHFPYLNARTGAATRSQPLAATG